MLKNTTQRYGLVSIFIHWLTLLTVLGLFGLGLWMTGLDYYHAWYKQAPDLHKSIGFLLLLLTLLRIAWLMLNPKPQPLPNSKRWERITAVSVHGLLYLLLFVVMCSGYLISTADGRSIAVFGGFDIPALPWRFAQQEDIAGKLHEVLAFTLIGVMLLHAAAALKHHFIDRDNTLRRMFSLPLKPSS